MPYDDFNLEGAIRAFGLTLAHHDLFAAVDPVEPSEHHRIWLKDWTPLALAVNTIQSRRQFITMPMLTEARRRAGVVFNVLPGVPLDVDEARGLSGECDYLLSRSPTLRYVEGPLCGVAVAWSEALSDGLGRCAAQMVAVRTFNEREWTPQAAVYGCVTSGNLWRFLKLVGNTLTIDRHERYISDAAKILGILVHIARGN